MGVECRWELGRGMFNNCVHLQVGMGNKEITCEMLVLRQCYRDVCMKGMTWQVFIKCSLSVYL